MTEIDGSQTEQLINTEVTEVEIVVNQTSNEQVNVDSDAPKDK